MAFSFKLTSLFFVPLLALVYFVVQFKCQTHWLKLAGVVLALCIGLAPYAKLYHDYRMVYPLQRWTNLLEFGPKQPNVFSFEEIKKEREKFGLSDHRDNQKVASSFVSKWSQNWLKLLYVPLGPFCIWVMILCLCMAFKKKEKWVSRGFVSKPFWLFFLIPMVSLQLSMLAWSFSPQAFTRYLLPMWVIWAFAMGMLLHHLSFRLGMSKYIKSLLIVCLFV